MKTWAEVRAGDILAGATMTLPVKSALDGIVVEERTEAAHQEWLRWKRANGVAAAGIRADAADLRKLAKRMDETADERDLERMATRLDAMAEQLDGEAWLQSPRAMQAMRALEHEKEGNMQADGVRT